MKDFTTIATFTLPSQLAVAKSKLESEGIECIVLDELTIQSYNFLSNAVGGVKLQVKESDYKKAYNILFKGGFINEQKVTQTFLERKLYEPKFLKRVKIFLISFLCISAVFAIGGLIFYKIIKPNNPERLTKENWCLDHLIYDEQVYYPYTLTGEIRLLLLGQCDEIIDFLPNGVVTIPGFESRPIVGKWELENKQLIISNIDTLDFVFEGVYDLDFSNTELVLYSKNTKIICVKP